MSTQLTDDGAFPFAGLIADATGDLFGTTTNGGTDNDGTVFELVKTGSGYTEEVLHSFGGYPTDGAVPVAGLIADAMGDLFGTTAYGGASGLGTVFELVNTGSGYAEKVLYSFSGGTTDGNHPRAGLLADAQGDLFGTTYWGGADHFGTVFELVNTGSSYAEKLLHSFSGGRTDGRNPQAGLIADAQGDLFGTTYGGGAHGEGEGLREPGFGTVFELVNAGSGYAEKVLYSFRGPANGIEPDAGLIADAKGDLFGTTLNDSGRVFELVNTGSGYTEKVLHSFSGGTTDGNHPYAGLIADAEGDLFGTTSGGGADNDGTVFELVKTGSGYTEKVLHGFSGGATDGADPGADLIADAEGDLFGTTQEGGAHGDGTAFELVKTGWGYTETIVHNFGGTNADTTTSIASVLNGLHFG